MLEIACDRAAAHPAAARLTFHQGNAEAIPLPDASADFVFAFDSYDHWQDKPAGLAEVRRILRPDGLFIAIKDGQVPGQGRAAPAFQRALAPAGLAVIDQKAIHAEDVAFTMWVCGRQ